MAKKVLPTNFMDDILNESMNGKRRWTITQNDDGTYTLEDATTYDQLGNTFGQAQVNEMNKAINESVDQARVIDDYKTLAAVNQEGFVPGAKPVAQLISDLSAMNDNGAITGMDAREDGVYITYVPADGADPVSKKLGSNGITYLGDMPYTCTQDYGDCTLLTFCHQKTATQNVTIKNLNGSYNIKQIVPAHIGGTLCFLAIVDVTSLNKGATIDTESSDTKRVFII